MSVSNSLYCFWTRFLLQGLWCCFRVCLSEHGENCDWQINVLEFQELIQGTTQDIWTLFPFGGTRTLPFSFGLDKKLNLVWESWKQGFPCAHELHTRYRWVPLNPNKQYQVDLNIKCFDSTVRLNTAKTGTHAPSLFVFFLGIGIKRVRIKRDPPVTLHDCSVSSWTAGPLQAWGSLIWHRWDCFIPMWISQNPG